MDADRATEVSIPGAELEAKKAVVQQTFRDVSRDFGLAEVATFQGFYSENSNARARYLGNEFSFNERFLSIPDEEVERVVCHELQHILNTEVLYKGENPEFAWLFVFHPSFKDLHQRMKAHYEKHKREGYSFGKEVKGLPAGYDDMISSAVNYAHPDEVLALLRGYERYLVQKEEKGGVSHDPYEFVDAFTPADLKFLDDEYRMKVGQEVLKQKPEVIPGKQKRLSLVKEDLK